MKQNTKINVRGTEIVILQDKDEDYISLTDMAKFKSYDSGVVIANWLTTKYTIQFMGTWEQINNPKFNLIEFHKIKNEVGTNGYIVSSSMWINSTNAIGIRSKAGRYGGTFAHRDIAFEFASWLSPEFKLYLITEFQRLKKNESRTLSLEWSLQRTLAKVNYKIHTDAIAEKLIPPELTKDQINSKYANEADLLNTALFGMTAKTWRDQNPRGEGNIRDYASLEQLVVLSNLESINAVLIHEGLPQEKRIQKLNGIAIIQMKSLLSNRGIKKLK